MTRTLTSTTRLLDVLAAFDGDPRVQVAFTLNEGSVFGDDARRFLDDLNARTVPWREAVRERYDLAIAATSNGGLHRLRAPLVVLPHGAGHNRLVESATGRTDVASGLSARQLTHRGRVVPAMIALSHEEQLARLRRSCAPAAARAVVTGDPCFDRMMASLPLRDGYRRALGVDEVQRLMMVTSTWGARSLLGRHHRMIARWVAELPLDRYRVALVLHPNVWSRHGGPQIRAWLAEALDAGLILIPPHDGWRAALIAADYVMGDHGSVTYYAAALGRPVLLAAFGEEEVAPDSPMAALGTTHPRLDPARSLRAQLVNLAPTPLTRQALGMRGQAMANLRAALYGLLALPPPATPPRLRPIPLPEVQRREISALVVEGTISGDVIELARHPATVERDHLDDPHLLVTEHEVDRRLLNSASAFARRATLPRPGVWAERALADHPGATIAVSAIDRTRSFVRLRDGRTLVASGADATISASAIYLMLAMGRPPDGVVHVSTGTNEFRIDVTPPPGP